MMRGLRVTAALTATLVASVSAQSQPALSEPPITLAELEQLALESNPTTK